MQQKCAIGESLQNNPVGYMSQNIQKQDQRPKDGWLFLFFKAILSNQKDCFMVKPVSVKVAEIISQAIILI